MASGAAADDVPPATDWGWSGGFVGGHLGAAWGDSGWQREGATGTRSGSLGLGNPYDFLDGSGSYVEGLQAGYDHQLSSGIVVGAVTDISFPNLISGTHSIDAGLASA